MWAFYEYPDTTFEELITPFNFPELRQKAKFAAIPSTSGTATEVTAFSVITDYAKGIKYPLADFNITPDVAIVDPVLAETMPKSLTAYTGMDALTHACLLYTSTANICWPIARCYERLGKKENAIEYFKKVLEDEPDNSEANGEIAGLYRQLLQSTEDLKYYDEGLPYARCV